MKSRSVYFLFSILILNGCTTLKLAQGNVAALYSTVNAKGSLVPVTYNYAIVQKIDGRYVPFDENPIFITQGTHMIEIRYGSCFSPVMVIACEFQPSVIKTMEKQFIGGHKYRLQAYNGDIVEI
jgi:hypothetical protein